MLTFFINKHSGTRRCSLDMKDEKLRTEQLSVGKVLWRSLLLGVRVKTPVSILVSLVGIPSAFVPLLISKKLQELTDLLFSLNTNSEITIKIVIQTMITLGLFFLMNMFYGFLAEYYTIQDNYRTHFHIKESVLQQVCNVHYSYLENRDDFLKKIEFADSYTAMEISRNIQTIFLVLQQMVTFLGISIVLWDVHPLLVVIVVVTGIPASILSYRQSDESFRHRAKWCEEGSLAIHYYHLCSSTEAGIQELRHYELYDYLKARWRAVADSYIYKKNQLTIKHLRANILADFLRSAVYLVILLITAKVIYDNPIMGLGTFTLVYTLSNRLQNSTSMILTEVMRYAVGLEYLREFFSLDDLEREIDEPIVESKLKKRVHVDRKDNGEIIFENVRFTYPGACEEVLHNISVTIPAGEKVAIVGENGSGKSTFISLLTGMFTPNSGCISIDGKSMETNKRELRNKISVIFQDFAHYEGTLRENIIVSDVDAMKSDEEIIELARTIHVEDVIEDQEKGLDGLLGNLSNKGRDLSGGQWQKVALLRAVYRDKTDIMILDEPTAVLDPLAEAELYRNFAQITGERTTLLISHRLGITKLVDRILVFKDGRIVEDGSHYDLMKQKGHYYEMYQAQASLYQEEM